MRHNLLLILIVSIFAISGCADKIVTECKTDTGKAQSQLFTFKDIQSRVFTPSCATVGCHRGSDSPFDLDLSEGKAYANLVNVPSGQEPALKRVLPGNSSRSYLIKVMDGSVPALMPPSGKLSDAIIDSIAAWIDRGALAE